MNTKRDFLKKIGFAGGMGMLASAVSMADEQSSLGKNNAPDNSDFFNVKDFGAKGDAKHSDSAAIQKAVDAAAKVGGVVYFPSGTYLCSNIKAYTGISFVAEPRWGYHSRAGAILKLESEDADCVLDVSNTYGLHVKGLFLVGISSAKKPIHGIYMNNQKVSPREDCIAIDDCKIEGFSGHGVYLKNVWLFIIRRNLMQKNKLCGVMLRGWDGFVMDNQFSANGECGFGSEGRLGTIKFTANRVEWNRKDGFGFCAGSTLNVTGNCFDRNWGAAINAFDIKTMTISGNIFRRNGKNEDAMENEKSCHLKINNCRGLTIMANASCAGQDDRNRGKFTPQIGFILENLSCAVVMGNTFYEGYTEKMIVESGNSEDCIIKDNIGTAFAFNKNK